MKKIFITILLAALMPFAAGAQDARQRTAETIVADALAQLPAQTPKAFDSLMQELAATGADGIRMMAAMLVPAAEGKNAPVEYAINGVVSYVTAAGREELAREIRAGLTDAVAASTDKSNQAFLLSQLQLCATAADTASRYGNVSVAPFDGLVRDFVVARGGKVMVRGVPLSHSSGQWFRPAFRARQTTTSKTCSTSTRTSFAKVTRPPRSSCALPAGR